MSKKHKAIIIASAVIIIVVSAFIFMREASPLLTAPELPTAKPGPRFTSTARLKALIEIRILSKKGKNIEISIHWENLPEGTTKLDIFRSLSEDGAGLLVKTLSIDESSLASGNAVATISGGQGSYFHAAAVSNSGSALFTSPQIIPSTASSSQQSPIGGSPPPASPPSPQPPAQNPSNPSASSSQPSPSSSSPANPYTIYYSPQGTISGSSTPQTANFWVQHIDQKIQIGWQNLSPDTDRIIVSRSASMDGPWTAILTQKNPVTDGPYSLQIVDNTLNDPYYYKLDIYHESALTATYGPIFLGPISR